MFDLTDWLDEIRDYTDTQIGSDGFVYGRYIEWGNFRKDFEEELLEEAGCYLPWGQTLTFKEYLNLVQEYQDKFSIDINDYLEDVLQCSNGTSYLSDIQIRFIDNDHEVAELLTSALLDAYGVPSETQYDDEGDFPSELSYWSH